MKTNKEGKEYFVEKMVLKNMLGWLANSESSFLMKRKH